MTKTNAIERSLRCFVFGLLALVPLAGVPLGALAVLNFHGVIVGYGSRWNPARRYLIWGFALGGLGLLASLLLFGLMLAAALGAFA